MKVSDYIVHFIEQQQVRHVFMLAGGMAMHIDDSLGTSKCLRPICMLHEQACAYAAESYARITNNLGVVVATSGPAAINVLNGVAASWIESTPLLVITGQCKRADIAQDSNLRQMGVQEVDIVSVAKPITKYVVQVWDPNMIQYELEKAVYIARHGRRGPVLLDIPVDVQSCKVDESEMPHFEPTEDRDLSSVNGNQLNKIVQLLNTARRPLLYAGAGIRMAKSDEEFRTLVERLGIPVLVHWNAMGIIESDHPLYAGIPGALGHRASNFALQTCDLLITIGTRLSLLQTGYNFAEYAKNAKLIMVDIDEAELNKPTIHPYMKVQADAGVFVRELNECKDVVINDYSKWNTQIQKWRKKYPSIKQEWRESKEYVNSFLLAETISKYMTTDDVYVGGRAGTCVDAVIQAFRTKRNQGVFVTKGLSAMGNGLPAAIGGAYATGKKVVCINGDGGFVMNIQELEVVRRDHLPIKIFILDNNGYSTVRNTQTNVFNKHYMGCSPESGLTVGNIKRIAEAYDIKTYEIRKQEGMDIIIKEALSYDGPVVVNVSINPDQPIEPRIANYKTAEGQMASRPLEDMRPLLQESEIQEIFSVTKEEWSH